MALPAILCLAVFFYGATGPLVAFPVLLLLWVASLSLTLRTFGDRGVWRPPGMMPLLGFLLLSLFQLVPLPPVLLQVLAPDLARFYVQGIWRLNPDCWLPLSCHPGATLTAVGWFWSGIHVYLLSAQARDDQPRQRQTVRFLLVAAGLYAFVGMLQFVVPGKRVFWLLAAWPERTSHHFGSMVNGNHYAALMGMLLPLAVVSFLLAKPTLGYGGLRERLSDLLSSLSLNRHLLYGLGAVLIYLSIFFSLSRGGVISSSLAMLLFGGLLLRSGGSRNRSWLLIGLMLLVVFAVGGIGWKPILSRFDRTLTAEGEIADQRLVYWQDSLAMVAGQPIAGSGLGSYASAYLPYKTAETGPFLVDHAHNDYVELLTDSGLLGTLLWGGFLLVALRAAWKGLKERRQAWGIQVGLALFCGLVAIGMHSVTDFNLRIPAVWLVFCFLFGLLQAISHTSSRRRKTMRSQTLGKKALLLGTLAFGLVVAASGLACYGERIFSRWSQTPLAELDSAGRLAAASDLELAAALNPLSARFPLALANLALLDKDYASADSLLLKSLRCDPLNPEFVSRLAQIKDYSGAHELAGGLFRAAMSYDPAGPLWRRQYGDWLFRQGRRSDGIAAWRQALILDSRRIKEYPALLDERQVTGPEWGEVLPDIPLVLAVFARHSEEAEKPLLAAQLYQRLRLALAGDDNPSSWQYLNLIYYYSRQKRWDEALLMSSEAVERCQPNPHLFARMGSLYQREGLNRKAVDAYSRALGLKPDLEWARKNLARLEGAGR